jgi:hypothetical protein
MGYIVARKSTDIEILVGLHPQFTYDDYKYARGATQISKVQIWSATLQIPIYLNFTPTQWCSFFGGLNYQYSYNYRKYNYSDPLQQYTNNSYTTSSNESGMDNSSYLYSSNNVYAGLELRHTSGLHVQCAFNGNISSYSNWNISLGYVY